jgi:hypothetical protein
MKDLLKYGLIASAGQPRSLTGEALIGLGALLSQMDFNLGEDEEVKTEEEERSLTDQLQLQKDLQEKSGKDTLAGAKVTLGLDKPINIFEEGIKDAKSKLKKDYLGRVGLGIGMELPQRISQGVIPMGPTTEENTLFQIPYITGYNPKPDNIFIGPENEQQTLENNSQYISRGAFFNPATLRLKPEVLQILDSARYKNKGKDDTPLHRVAHITKSPYLRTDNVDYRQMRKATAPGYTGEIGKAAVEGYNLVIDKYNYDQAVKADYEEEVEDQMGSLNVEADFLTDQARQDYLELSMGKKKRLNEAFNSYANGDISKLDYENVKASLVSELQSAAATRTNITNSIKDFIENKGTIDTEASDPEMLDFLMTGEKSPERISIKNIDGIDYVTGTTRGGRDFKIPTSKIANGTAGFRVVKKASLAPVISGALKNINAYTSTVKTDLGFGVSTPNAKKARDIGIASIRTNLGSNEADLRSIMAQIYGVNHTAYQNFLGSDPAANKSAMLDDAAEYLYDTQVAEKYFPMTKTTRFTTERTGGTTAGEREVAQTKANFNKLGTITQGNYQKFLTAVPDFRSKYRTIGPKDGVLQVGDLKGNLLVTIDFSNPEQAKTDLASLAGVAGYQSGQAQNAENFRTQYKY